MIASATIIQCSGNQPKTQNKLRIWASLIAHLVKNLPVMQETLVRFLGQKDPLEKEMTTHSSILA